VKVSTIMDDPTGHTTKDSNKISGRTIIRINQIVSLETSSLQTTETTTTTGGPPTLPTTPQGPKKR
ncbi:hypothetical protein, partial [Pseudomonas reactans]|uniref:hypothetical protein n=1 Tax=Pseudomonas reactans TaxID=117680 RepID=UPI001C4D3479